MKHHIRLKLKRDTSPPNIPHWQQIIHNKSIAATSLQPDIDQVFRQYSVPVWFTREYHPAVETWSQTERESGLDRVYKPYLALPSSNQYKWERSVVWICQTRCQHK
jgi:hypothetical protein